MIYCVYDDFDMVIGDVSEDPDDGLFYVYHYGSDEHYGPFDSKEEAEVRIMELEYDLK